MADQKKSPEKHHPSRSVGSKSAMTRIILTNYRICLVSKGDMNNDADQGDNNMVLVQVVLGSIASMDLDDEQRLLLVLKFDGLQYTILQDPVPPGPPDIYSVPVEVTMERSRKDKRNHGKKDDFPSTDVLLGWAGGYDIQKEFERLRFRTKHWSVEDINMSFEVSPTYPRRFIMPTSFLRSIPALPSTTCTNVPLERAVRPPDARQSSHPNEPPTPPPPPHPQRTPTNNNRQSMPAPPPPPHHSMTGELPPGPHCYHGGMEKTVRSVVLGVSSPEARMDRLQKLASFRSNARFPMISWKSPRSGLMLMRCSQPMVGLLGARGPEDELYIRLILETAAEEHSRSASNPKLCIMDARAYSSAVANGYIGGGRENASWLTHVADLLKAAGGRDGIVGKMIQDNYSVLVQHPSHFEYNDYLLVTLARAQSGVSPFGDFFFNSELERRDSQLRERTASIWSYAASEDADPENWRKDVLSVQTGGRFMTVWTEYHFEATPGWFPNPRHVFTESVESLSGGEGIGKRGVNTLAPRKTSAEVGSERQPTTTTTIVCRNRRKIKDPWCASLFDPVYIQQLVFPGFAAQQQQQRQNSGLSAHPVLQASPLLPSSSTFSSSSSSPESRIMIPPALALLKGPEMHAYYTLVQYLRSKRRAQVQAAFEAWYTWAAKRVAAKQAQDAGWGLVGKDDDDDDYVEDMLRKPRLMVAAKKGVQVEMDRIIQAGPYFGSGPVEFEEETEEEEQEQEEEEKYGDGEHEETDEDLCDIGVVSEEVDGFDDFGFPVESP
ncbi:hypothetical protein BGZ81_001315 [Podila clonocystis]|nr:hypothetical protein BGZ81_001315 [Podila clonocystis]